MSIKKFIARSAIFMLALLLLFTAYLTLTINRNSNLKKSLSATETDSLYVIPNVMVKVGVDDKEWSENRELNLIVNIENIKSVSKQVIWNDKKSKTEEHTVVQSENLNFREETFSALNKTARLQPIEGSENSYYQNSNGQKKYYTFPNEETLIISDYENILEQVKEQPKATFQAKKKPSLKPLASSSDFSFYLESNNEQLNHFTNNLPPALLKRFNALGGQLSKDNTSYIEIEMENAYYARMLEMALPSIISTLNNKIKKVNGKFVISGNNVVLSQDQVQTIEKISENATIKNSGKSILILLENAEERETLLELIRGNLIKG